ncbi:MAG: hypothetical protein HY762_07310 [Planctomycetes bacterium]|nr:hypothetical protein [Planctomycetota bacterium]
MRIYGIVFCLFGLIAFWHIGCRSASKDNPNTESEMISFRTVKDTSGTIIGYVEEIDWKEKKPLPDRPAQRLLKVYYTYNASFRQLGFISEHGVVEVYKYEQKGETTRIGVYTVEGGIKKILGLDKDTKIYLEEFSSDEIPEIR